MDVCLLAPWSALFFGAKDLHRGIVKCDIGVIWGIYGDSGEHMENETEDDMESGVIQEVIRKRIYMGGLEFMLRWRLALRVSAGGPKILTMRARGVGIAYSAKTGEDF